MPMPPLTFLCSPAGSGKRNAVQRLFRAVGATDSTAAVVCPPRYMQMWRDTHDRVTVVSTDDAISLDKWLSETKTSGMGVGVVVVLHAVGWSRHHIRIMTKLRRTRTAAVVAVTRCMFGAPATGSAPVCAVSVDRFRGQVSNRNNEVLVSVRVVTDRPSVRTVRKLSVTRTCDVDWDRVVDSTDLSVSSPRSSMTCPCPVCFLDAGVFVTLGCGHATCVSCCARWFLSSGKYHCPLCRREACHDRVMLSTPGHADVEAMRPEDVVLEWTRPGQRIVVHLLGSATTLVDAVDAIVGKERRAISPHPGCILDIQCHIVRELV